MFQSEDEKEEGKGKARIRRWSSRGRISSSRGKNMKRNGIKMEERALG